jgi:filamentous hemagglutinin family protein
MASTNFYLLFCALLLLPSRALAQIIPDNTLGPESSRSVSDTINNLPSDRIDGGATRGSSLFHSFGEFNIGEGRGAYFENPSGITNIFSRVTGGNPSNILGTLGVLGNANLFLINQKGIVFGPHARLDVRGSFLASTADSIVFKNGVEFSSANPQAVPLLTVNIPVGLRFRENPGAIVNASSVTEVIAGTTIPVGLAVPPGQTLAMVGGDVIFNNGFASTLSGNIQLGSVASPGLVSFNITPEGLGLDYTNVGSFGNIELSGLSAVTASGPGGGAIALRSGNVTLRDGSSLVSDTWGSIDGRGINIEAARFSLLDRAFVGSTTSGSGAGGPIEIRTAENIELKGIGYENFRRRLLDPDPAQKPPDLGDRESTISTGTVGAGKGGEIVLDTKRLTIREGSAILNPTLGTGDGGGGVTIRASESVEINASGLFTTTFNSPNAGSIVIKTAQLSVTDGAIVSPSTLGAGNSGDETVKFPAPPAPQEPTSLRVLLFVQQPQNIVNPAALIAANPCTKGTESAFTVTGKGGVPASPDDTLSSAASPWRWVEEAGSSATDNVRDVTDRQAREFGEIRAREVVPARGWVVNARGEVMLVANQVAGQLDDRTRHPVSVCQPR